jgi:hypothetical protein
MLDGSGIPTFDNVPGSRRRYLRHVLMHPKLM